MAEIDLREAMSTLRAVRRLKSDPIEAAVLDRIFEAASWAPTGGNAQPFRIVMVRDRTKMARLGELYAKGWHEYATGHRALIADAPSPIRDAAEKTFAAGDYLAEHFAQTPVLLVFCFNPKNMAITDARLDRVSVVGGASVYPAVQNALLACRAEGLGCVLTTLLCQCEEDVRTLLEIPDPWGTAAAIPIGLPVLGGHGPISRRPIQKLVFSDSWGQAYGGEGDEEVSRS